MLFSFFFFSFFFGDEWKEKTSYYCIMLYRASQKHDSEMHAFAHCLCLPENFSRIPDIRSPTQRHTYFHTSIDLFLMTHQSIRPFDNGSLLIANDPHNYYTWHGA